MQHAAAMKTDVCCIHTIYSAKQNIIRGNNHLKENEVCYTNFCSHT
jgi:hypothetical protein